jgi:GDP-L-galactose phosphorylase
VLLAKWEDRCGRGLFRYDVTACPTRVLDGVYGFVAQLNEGRATKKRATEFAVDAVCAAFDPSKFNFTKADEAEVLFQFEPASSSRAAAAPGPPGYTERGAVEASPNLVLINVSPIEYGHVLLVPHVLSALPQQLSPDLLLLALHLAREANNPYFRVGYNSMGAYATINHLHFQAYYLTAPFPIERAPTGPLPGAAKRRRWRGVSAHRVARFPVRALVFEVGASLEEMAEAVGAAAEALQAANVPFNLLIADRGARVFLIPQRFAARVARGDVPEDLLATGINPAVFEIAGHLLYKRQEDYDTASQETAWRLLAEASLTEEEFAALCDTILPA